MIEKIPVGISSCLLGNEVRYDGRHKHSRYCTEILARYFELRPICPELEAGLGVPRPPIHLRDDGDELRLVEVSAGTDHTAAMDRVIDRAMASLGDLRGFVLKAKSPSCGLERIPVHDLHRQIVRHNGRGMFAEALVRYYPRMPVAEETHLEDDQLRADFIGQVLAYHKWRQTLTGEE